MATFTKSLEQAISQAFKFATEKKHQYVTLEHLLLALTDETDARNVMKACNVDVDLLNENLESYIDNELENIVTTDTKLEPQPTASFQRVIQRSMRLLMDTLRRNPLRQVIKFRPDNRSWPWFPLATYGLLQTIRRLRSNI